MLSISTYISILLLSMSSSVLIMMVSIFMMFVIVYITFTVIDCELYTKVSNGQLIHKLILEMGLLILLLKYTQ